MAGFYDLLIDAVLENSSTREQHLLNAVLQENVLGIRYRIMDPILFPNAFQYFSRAISARANVKPFCIHNNWLDGSEIKKYRFREINKWAIDSPEYFSTQARKYQAFHEPSLADTSWDSVRNSLRSAIAISRILNRTLILPKFYSQHTRSPQVTLDYFLDYVKFAEGVPVSDLSSVACAGWVVLVHTLWVPLRRTFAKHLFSNVYSLNHPPESTISKPAKKVLVTYLSKSRSPVLSPAMDSKTARFELGLSHSRTSPYFDSPSTDFTSSSIRRKKMRSSLSSKKLSLLPLICWSHWSSTQQTVQSSQWSHKVELCSSPNPALERHRCTVLEDVVTSLTQKIPTSEPLYVTSDFSDNLLLQQAVLGIFPLAFSFINFSTPSMAYLQDTELGFSMRVGAIEQWTCAWAAEFVGDLSSPFSSHVCYLRSTRGKSSQKCRDIFGRV